MNESNPLTRYLVALQRWRYVVLGVTAAGLLLTWWTLPDGPREPTPDEIADPDTTFRATHLLIRNSASPEPINFDLVELLARQGDLASRVLERMDGQISTRDVDDVALETDPDLGTISITATQPTPDLAATLVTTYAEELQEIIDERAGDALRQESERVSERLPALMVEIDELEGRLSGLAAGTLDHRLVDAELEVLIADFASAQAEGRALAARINELESQFDTLQEPAPVASDADDDGLLGVPTATVPRFLAFGLLSLLAGAALAFAIDYFDTRIRTRSHAELAFGLPVIAELPNRSRRQCDAEPLPVVTDPSGITAESFRALRLSVLLAPTWRLTGTAPTSNGSVGSAVPLDGTSQPRVLLVSSPSTGDGKSMTVANLAACFAESGQRVLVVDCDFRQATLPSLFAAEPQRGLRDISEPDGAGFDGLLVPTEVAGVSLVASGGPGRAPAWFLDSARLLVAWTRQNADVVIFDTGPLTVTNEASALIPSVDTTVLVNRVGKLTRAQARITMEQLTRLGAPISGVVMVGSTSAQRYGYETASTTAKGTEQGMEKAPLS